MSNVDPRVPDDSADVYAMAFMVGYLGNVPVDLLHAFPDADGWGDCPYFIPDALAHEWKRGYDSGLSFYTDHVDTRRGRR